MHGNPERTRLIAGTATFVALIAAGAWVAIPVGPVPVTLQTFFLLLAAPVMKRHAVVPAAVYLLLGTLNLPVFHAGLSGIGVLLGPSGGFLVGFVPAALVAGLAYETRSRPVRATGLACATGIIYACGVAWLMVSAGLTLPAAFLVGVIPFIPGDILKCAGVFFLGERLA
jgi:biotin transport system substrate-specific component